MGLRIAQLVTTCHVPRPYASHADIVDRLAHGRLAADLAAHLGPSLSSQPAIVRIRSLPMRVIIRASDFNEDSLSHAWTQAFGRALFTALAYPTGAGPVEIFRADSLAAFLAGAVRDLLDGTAPSQWQYAEFEEFFRLGATQGAVALLCEWPDETLSILLELAQSSVLDRLLSRLDDLALERLFAALAAPGDAEPPPLSIPDLIQTAKLVQSHLPDKASALRARRYALRLFVEARRVGESARSPRAIFHGLLALALLLNQALPLNATSLPDEDAFFPGGIRDAPAPADLPAAVAALIQTLRVELLSRPPAPHLIQLHRLLTDLRVELGIPSPSPAPPQARWISSGWCGLFFLSSTLHQLGWIPAWRKLGQFQSGGISPLLAGLALAIVGKFDPAPLALDPGLALFCGYVEPPDLVHLRTVFQQPSPEIALQVLPPALRENQPIQTWSSVFDQLADHLLRTFASRIRGFRQATTRSIVRAFIERPGRIRVEPERIVVLPHPSPFHVALHIAGMDSPIESLSWLGPRRLEFELGDL